MSESGTVPSTEGKVDEKNMSNDNGVMLYVKASVVENEKGLNEIITEDGHIMDYDKAMSYGTADMTVYTAKGKDEYQDFKKGKMNASKKDNINYVKECIRNGNTKNNPDYNVARATLSEEEFAKAMEEPKAEASKSEKKQEEAQVK